MPSKPDTSLSVHQRRERAGEVLVQLLQADERLFVRIAAFWLTRKQNAEDVVQSAAISFIQAYDPSSEGDARAYFVAAVRTHAWKVNRTASRHPEHLTGDSIVLDYATADRVGSDLPEYVAEVDAIRQALAKLKPRERHVVALKALGFERDEVTALLAISDRSQRKAVERGRAQLRVELGHR